MNVKVRARAAILDHEVTLRMQTAQDKTRYEEVGSPEDFSEEHGQTHAACFPVGIYMSGKHLSVLFKSLLG